MQRGGQTIFHGALGQGACKLVSYFEGLKGVDAMSPGWVPLTALSTSDTVGTSALHGPHAHSHCLPARLTCCFALASVLLLHIRNGSGAAVHCVRLPAPHAAASNTPSTASPPAVPTCRANPATWMLDVTTPAVEQATGGDFADHYTLSELYEANEQAIEKIAQPEAGEADLCLADLAAASTSVQVRGGRALLNCVRNRSASGSEPLI